MSFRDKRLQLAAQRVLTVQLALVLIVAAGAILLTGNGMAAISAIYGGAIAMAGTAYAAYRVRRASELAYRSPGASVAALYVGAIIRFILVTTGLSVGLVVLKWPPLPMILAFALAHAGYLAPPPRQ